MPQRRAVFLIALDLLRAAAAAAALDGTLLLYVPY